MIGAFLSQSLSQIDSINLLVLLAPITKMSLLTKRIRCPYGMNVKEIGVTNAANLSFFMVNFSYALLQPFRSHNPEYSILDLKSHYRGCRYIV